MMDRKDITITKTDQGTKAVLETRSRNIVRRNPIGTLPSSQMGSQTSPATVVDTADPEGMRALSGLISRLQLATLAGVQFGGKRNLYEVFGYNVNLQPEDFLAKYARQDIASRIVDAPPGATWANPPTLEDGSAIKTKWDELVKKSNLWGAMYRVDRLARLNSFSILLFGFDDVTDLTKPLSTSDRKPKELLYVRAIGARQVDELTFVSDIRNPRFGLPEMYSIKFDDPATKRVASGSITTRGLKSIKVHASRVVHVVENPLEDETFGYPIMEKVYNLLDDLLKVAGGTSEMFWLTGNRGMQADVDKDMDLDPNDAKALSDELEEYQHQLRRILRTRGVKLNVLESTTPDPKEVFDMIMALLSGTTGIPRRILLGSEAGQLASEQDRANWSDRIAERRSLFCTPTILMPTVRLLQTVDLLPEGEVEFEWPSAFIMSPLETGMAQAQTARAIGNISRQTGAKTPMQITSRVEARGIMGLKGDLKESDIIDTDEPEDEPTGEDKDSEGKTKSGGGDE